MAFFHSSDAFDGNSFFDEEDRAEVPATPKRMNAKIRLDITDKDEVATLAVSTRHTQAMAEPDAAPFFPHRTPPWRRMLPRMTPW